MNEMLMALEALEEENPQLLEQLLTAGTLKEHLERVQATYQEREAELMRQMPSMMAIERAEILLEELRPPKPMRKGRLSAEGRKLLRAFRNEITT